MRIALLHGWGFDRTVWNAVLPLLGGFACTADDRGYFGSPEAAPEADLVVGHSLGALRALLAPPAGTRAVLAINGFDCFTARSDFPAGVPARVLDRMLARLPVDPAAVLGEFRTRCGAPPAPGTPGAGTLAADLALLRDGDARGRWTGLLARLDGADDPILTPAHRAACFAGRADVAAQTLPGQGHLLPLTAPEACAAAIRTLAGQMS